MSDHDLEYWEVWYPEAAATGLLLGRGQVDAGASKLLVHAAGPMVAVTVRASDGRALARGENLRATADTPIARLTRRGDTIEREDIWPGEADIGTLVLLPGGEVGTLLKWWNAEDHSEWRWQIELYNRR